MTFFEVLPQVLLSPYIIGVTLFIIIYGSIISAVANRKERIHKMTHKKPVKIRKPIADKPGLAKNEDVSELGLD
jgi:hypothetical protein